MLDFNKLYGVSGLIVPDYFDCKMLNDLVGELRDELRETVVQARDMDAILGMTRSITSRHYYMRTRQAVYLYFSSIHLP